MKPELFRIGASTLLADIERQVRSSSLLSLEHLTSIFKKEIKNHLFKEDLQMDNAQMERCSTSLIIREQRSKLQRGITSHWSESVQFSSVQSFSRVRLFETPWTAARQASLSITNAQSLLKLMSIESVMPSNHLILRRPLLLLPSVFPSIRIFSNVSSSYQVAKVLEFQLQHQTFQ